MKRKAAPMSGHSGTGHLQSQQKQQQPASACAGSAAVTSCALVACFESLTFTPTTVGAWLRTCGISTAKAEVIPVDRQAIAACFSIKLQSGVPRRASNSDQHVRPKPAHDSDCGRPKSNLKFRPKFRPKHVRPKPPFLNLNFY